MFDFLRAANGIQMEFFRSIFHHFLNSPRVLVRFNHVACCIVNAKLSDRTLPENAFSAIVNFVEISLCVSVARSPIATTFSCSELAAAGYCILAQEHQKQADRPTA